MTGNKAISRPPLWASLFTILGVIILCTLGIWQFQRLEWKTELLNAIAQESQKDASDNPLSKKELFNPQLSYVKGSLTGHFARNYEIFLTPRTYEGEIGFHVIALFILEDGTQILVNRGWHPGKDKADHLPSLLKQTIIGAAKKPPSPNYFTPENNPKQKQWYWLDVAEIARLKSLENLAPVVFYQEHDENCCEFLKPIAPGMFINNNHLQYAYFWFAMAAVLIMIYLLRFVIKVKST